MLLIAGLILRPSKQGAIMWLRICKTFFWLLLVIHSFIHYYYYYYYYYYFFGGGCSRYHCFLLQICLSLIKLDPLSLSLSLFFFILQYRISGSFSFLKLPVNLSNIHSVVDNFYLLMLWFAATNFTPFPATFSTLLHIEKVRISTWILQWKCVESIADMV